MSDMSFQLDVIATTLSPLTQLSKFSSLTLDRTMAAAEPTLVV